MMDTLSTDTIAKSCYTLNYGLRLDKGTASELTHPRVPILLPDGSVGNMTLHVMNGTADEIKAQLLDSIDAFFDIYADVYGDVSRSTIVD
ncbi:MAG: hypothetical protein OEY77_14105 [Nitrospira sp.]|nr:hypothetical protein [Nitrospira sp.]